ETNQLTSTVTNSAGQYTTPYLQPGKYSISVEAPGFKKLVRDNLVLNIAQTVTLDLTLEVGGVTEQVTVTAEAPLLETSKADRGGVIDRERVHELPLNGRNPFMLAKFVGGVNFNGQPIWERPFDNGAIANWSVNGGRASTNEFLLDGAPNNSQAGSNNIAYVPPVDAVQEFKIQTNSYDAQYGHTGGGIVNVSLKSGTNRLHGTVYEFARRNAWDANSFQNNAFGAPRFGHYLNQYGAELDGPVYIPKLYNGRNKTFFLFNYERYREGTPQPLILSVPEPEMRQGDFSKLVDARGRAITMYDPATGRQEGTAWVRSPFPGNVIPRDRLNPTALQLIKYFPAPNTKTPGVNYASSNFFLTGGEGTARDKFYNLVAKVDQNLGARNHVFVRFGNNDRKELRTSNGIFDKPGADGQLPLRRANWTGALDWTASLSPSLLFVLRTSLSRYIDPTTAEANRDFDLLGAGFSQRLVSQLPFGSWFPRISISGFQSLGR